MRRLLGVLAVWILAGLLLLPGFAGFAQENRPPAQTESGLPPVPPPPQQRYLYGVVISVKKVGNLGPGEALFQPLQAESVLQRVQVRLTSEPRIEGLKRGDVVTVENVIGENPANNIQVEPGVRVLLNAEQNPDQKSWTFYIANRDRTPALIVLGTVLALTVLILGGSDVLKHVLLALALLLGIYQILFPAVMTGQWVIPRVIGFCYVYTVLGSFIYKSPEVPPFSREQWIVILGSLGGLAIMGIVVWIMHHITPLYGYSDEALISLWYESHQVDYWGLFVASALIAFQGFIFYLAWMLAQNRKETLGFRERFDIVMMRGRRLLGPMLSSLGLLFVGLYAPLLLQMQAIGTSTAEFANLEKTASVITMAFAGGLALMLTVPLTALLSAWLLHERESGQESGMT